MAYTSNIPQSTDATNASQPQILANFSSIGTTLLGVDSAGILFTNQSSSYTGSPGNNIEIFSRVSQNPAQTGANANVLCTSQGGNINEFTGGIYAGSPTGWTRLPSGLLMKWATVNIILADPGVSTRLDTFNWPTAATVPVFANIPNNPFMWQISNLTNSALGVDTANSFISPQDSSNTLIALQIESYLGNPITFTGGWQSFSLYVFALGVG